MIAELRIEITRIDTYPSSFITRNYDKVILCKAIDYQDPEIWVGQGPLTGGLNVTSQFHETISP